MEGCIYTPIDCNDNNVCTEEQCDVSLDSCVFTNITCAHKPCQTLLTCDSMDGCLYTPVDCNDNNVCTEEQCDVGLDSCVYSNITCATKPCHTFSMCDSMDGCLYTPIGIVNKINFSNVF